MTTDITTLLEVRISCTQNWFYEIVMYYKRSIQETCQFSIPSNKNSIVTLNFDLGAFMDKSCKFYSFLCSTTGTRNFYVRFFLVFFEISLIYINHIPPDSFLPKPQLFHYFLNTFISILKQFHITIKSFYYLFVCVLRRAR